MKDKGNNNTILIIGVFVIVGGLAGFIATQSSNSPKPQSAVQTNPTNVPYVPRTADHPFTQQQDTFTFTQPTPAVEPALCKTGGVNNEPEILLGYWPVNGEPVGQNGQLKVWVTDEGSPFIALGEQVDPNSGQIIAAGDRSGKAPDGFLWEPALYIAPGTAESGGTPHYPNYVRGDYNNNPPKKAAGSKTNIAIEPPPTGGRLLEYTSEFIWDVSSLGLAPGNYIAEFVIHDGDHDRGVGCFSLVIL